MAVVYRCKICERDHLYLNTLDGKEGFESCQMRTVCIQCCDTGRSALYGKKDMRWKDLK